MSLLPRGQVANCDLHTWLVMILATRGSGASKQGLMHDVSSRFMGLIVLSMGVQFVLTGLKQFL